MMITLVPTYNQDAYIDKGLGPAKCGRGWVGVKGSGTGCRRAKAKRSEAALKRVKEGRARPEDKAAASYQVTKGQKVNALKMAQEVRKAKAPAPVAKGKKSMNPDKMAKLIGQIDREMGTDNYVPIYEIVNRSGLPKKDVVKMLYALQKSDRLELGSLQEQKNYTAKQIRQGSIEQVSIGGTPLPPLFFASLAD